MTSRALAISNGEADLTDGFKTVASDAGSLPRGGTPGAAQSEREKRGPRHSEPVSQVALDGSGWSRHRIGQDDGSAPASKIVEAWGPTSEAARPRGWSSYAFAQALTIQQLPYRKRNSSDDARERRTAGLGAMT